MTAGRQVRLVRGAAALDLRGAPYDLDAHGWSSGGTVLEMQILVSARTWAELERHVDALRRLVLLGEQAASRGSGELLYVQTKLCDRVLPVAEVGATWRRKAVRGGRVLAKSTVVSEGGITQWVTLSLEVDAVWRRAGVCPVLEVAPGGTVTVDDGGLCATGTGVYARRLGWTSSTGFTARFLWRYAAVGSVQVNFMRLSGNFRLYWAGAALRWYLLDDTGATRAQSGAQSYTAGQVVDVVVRFGVNGCALWIDGALAASYSGVVMWPADPERYRLIEPDAGATATILSGQVWPTVLSDADCASLATRGRPAAELAWTVTPAAAPCMNSAAVWRIWNIPGTVEAGVCAVVSGTTDYDRLDIGIRPGGVPAAQTGGPVTAFECEAGTLGSGVGSTADAGASGGAVARWTPATTSWGTRVTVSIAADAANVGAYVGRWRVMLLARDNATAVQINQVRARMVTAGQAGAYLPVMALPAVGMRCLVSLGVVTIPDGAWPEGSTRSGGVEFSGDMLRLEIEAMNSIGSGGGTLDLDAVFLAPAEIESRVVATTWAASEQVLLLDFASDPPSPVVIFDTWRTLEFAGWVAWSGSEMALAPTGDGDDGALLRLFGYRSEAGEARPTDTLYAWLLLRPGWED